MAPVIRTFKRKIFRLDTKRGGKSNKARSKKDHKEGKALSFS